MFLVEITKESEEVESKDIMKMKYASYLYIFLVLTSEVLQAGFGNRRESGCSVMIGQHGHKLGISMNSGASSFGRVVKYAPVPSPDIGV